MVKRIILWTSVILLSVLIFSFSAETGSKSNVISEGITQKIVKSDNGVDTQNNSFHKAIHQLVRKSAHFLEFALLGILVYYLVKSYNLPLKLCVVISLAYALIFAISDEVHQLFIPGRSGRIVDVIIDFGGSIIGVGILLLKDILSQKKIQNKQF